MTDGATVPSSPSGYLWVLAGRWDPSGSLAGDARLSVLAPGWAQKGGILSSPPMAPSPVAGRSPLLSPLCCAGPYQELLGDDGDADSAAGRRLRGSEGLR